MIEQPNSGLAAARNRGAREAGNPVVVFLDDDIEMEPHGLRAHADAHARAPEPHMALGYYPPAIDGDDLWSTRLRLWWEDHFRRKGEPGHLWTFLDVVDGNSSMHVSALLEHGAFDERFSGGRRQDYELGIRLLKAGVPMAFHREAMGWHRFDARLETAFANAREEGRYDVYLASKHPEAKERLPLGVIARRLRRPRRAALTEHRFLRRVPSEAALGPLKAFESVRARKLWKTTLDEGLVRAYWLGAMEACGGPEALRLFLEEIKRGERRVAHAVDIDGSLPMTLPDASAPIDLRLRLAGRPVSTVQPFQPNEQWDWDTVLERAEIEAPWPLALRLALDAMMDNRERRRGG